MRLSGKLYAEIAAWAEDDFRSVNGQIEYLLTECVKRRKGKNRVDRSFTPSLLPNDAIDYLKYCLNKEIFNPMRSRADFIEFTRNL